VQRFAKRFKFHKNYFPSNFKTSDHQTMADTLEGLINDVKEKIGSLIAKPKMTDKLLSKPPFRFLHDTISAVCKTTGFAEGLYNETEMDSAAISEKNAKIAYLEKIFNLVGICKVSLK
jgi:TRAF3-interacting protein 1